MEKMHDWKAIDLQVTSVNMLIQAVGDFRVPQRYRRRTGQDSAEEQRTVG